jgi:hypothetical protein
VILSLASALDRGINDTYFILSNLATTYFVGAFLACFVLMKTQCREIALAIILVIGAVVMITLDASVSLAGVNFGQSDYISLTFGFTVGALIFWSFKLGYLSMVYTGNLQKISEALFRFIFHVQQGGDKLRGDLLVLIAISIAFVTGCLFCASMELLPPYAVVLPICIIYPLTLFTSTNFWRLYTKPMKEYIFSSAEINNAQVMETCSVHNSAFSMVDRPSLRLTESTISGGVVSSMMSSTGRRSKTGAAVTNPIQSPPTRQSSGGTRKITYYVDNPKAVPLVPMTTPVSESAKPARSRASSGTAMTPRLSVFAQFALEHRKKKKRDAKILSVVPAPPPLVIGLKGKFID